MLPLVVVVVASCLARLSGALFEVGPLDSWTEALAVGLAAMLALMASAHFVEPRRRALIDMVPPVWRRPGLWVTITGWLEIAGAVGLLVPVTRVSAAVCVALLLVAMYPANVHAARRGVGIRTVSLPVRTLIQVALVAACMAVATSGVVAS